MWPSGESHLAALNRGSDPSGASKKPLRTGTGSRVDIITGVEHRRRWRLDEKLRIVAEAEAPGACFVEVTQQHDVSRGLLWHWRRQVRSGELRPLETPAFLPV